MAVKLSSPLEQMMATIKRVKPCTRAEQAEYLAKEAAADRDRMAQVMLEACGIGRRFWTADITTMIPRDERQTKTMARVIEYLDERTKEDADKGLGAMLIGHPGTGKTHLLAAILKEMARHGTIAYVTAEAYFVGLRSCMSKAAIQTEEQFIATLATPRTLAFDDLHSLVEGDSYQKRMLWHLLDKRYGNCLPTLSASNLTAKELEAKVDKRIIRRFNAKVIA